MKRITFAKARKLALNDLREIEQKRLIAAKKEAELTERLMK